MINVKQAVRDFFALLFPHACVACGQPLYPGEDSICTACWYHLPYTHFHRDPDNDSARQLWGRVSLQGVTSYLFFRKHSRVQQLLHLLKYGHRPEIGRLIGQRYGELLRTTEPFSSADLIVPVPLHPGKLRQRGYNQSTCFAEGLSQAMGKPVCAKGLARLRAGESQTRKNRYQRSESMEELFRVPEPEKVAGKHILLVDDVLTTGATIAACANTLLTCGATAISVATIARAR